MVLPNLSLCTGSSDEELMNDSLSSVFISTISKLIPILVLPPGLANNPSDLRLDKMFSSSILFFSYPDKILEKRYFIASEMCISAPCASSACDNQEFWQVYRLKLLDDVLHNILGTVFSDDMGILILIFIISTI